LLLQGYTQLLLYGQLEARHTGMVIYLHVTHMSHTSQMVRTSHMYLNTRHIWQGLTTAACRLG
jgi:hypothetical protein